MADAAASGGLGHEEWVEQAYFFRLLRERVAQNVPAQDALDSLREELLTTTKLPMAAEFLATELRHSGLLGDGLARLGHYFTPFQTFVVRQAEDERRKMTLPVALLVLEREAHYKSGEPAAPGLFVYQFEAIARNKLGYDAGLAAVAADPFYDADWRAYLDLVRRQVGVIDFADLVYVRSELYVQDQRRTAPGYAPPVPPLFGDKEGRIARASRGRDPLYLFSALQRQLNYPEVPRLKKADDLGVKLAAWEQKVRDLDTRIRMLEAEQRGTLDPTKFGPPEGFRRIQDDDEGK